MPCCRPTGGRCSTAVDYCHNITQPSHFITKLLIIQTLVKCSTFCKKFAFNFYKISHIKLSSNEKINIFLQLECNCRQSMFLYSGWLVKWIKKLQIIKTVSKFDPGLISNLRDSQKDTAPWRPAGDLPDQPHSTPPRSPDPAVSCELHKPRSRR